jgi:hypothetical protein
MAVVIALTASPSRYPLLHKDDKTAQKNIFRTNLAGGRGGGKEHRQPDGSPWPPRSDPTEKGGLMALSHPAPLTENKPAGRGYRFTREQP